MFQFQKSVDSIVLSINTQIEQLEQLASENEVKAKSKKEQATALLDEAALLLTESVRARRVAEKLTNTIV